MPSSIFCPEPLVELNNLPRFPNRTSSVLLRAAPARLKSSGVSFAILSFIPCANASTSLEKPPCEINPINKSVIAPKILPTKVKVFNAILLQSTSLRALISFVAISVQVPSFFILSIKPLSKSRITINLFSMNCAMVLGSIFLIASPRAVAIPLPIELQLIFLTS